MKIYLASGFSHRYILQEEAEHLRLLGHEITSSWIWLEGRPSREDPGFQAFAEEIAARNVSELTQSGWVIVDANGIRPSNNGGVHFELGWAIGAGRRAVLIGPRGNTFHWFHGIERHEDWKSFYRSEIKVTA